MDLEAIEINGGEFVLGCLPRTEEYGSVCSVFGDDGTPEIIHQDKWEKLIDFEDRLPPITPQGQHGSCVATNTTDMIKGALNLMNVPIQKLGDPLDLSPWDLYRRICGGRDAGANISSGVRELMTNGVCRLKTVPSFTLSSRNPQGWDTEAAQCKITKAFDCATIEALCSAMQYRFFCTLGLSVYANFQSVDGDNVIPRPAGRVRGGHCVGACGLRYFHDQWQLKICTKSWGEDIFDKGCAWYPTQYLRESQIDAWAIQSVSYIES